MTSYCYFAYDAKSYISRFIHVPAYLGISSFLRHLHFLSVSSPSLPFLFLLLIVLPRFQTSYGLASTPLPSSYSLLPSFLHYYVSFYVFRLPFPSYRTRSVRSLHTYKNPMYSFTLSIEFYSIHLNSLRAQQYFVFKLFKF